MTFRRGMRGKSGVGILDCLGKRRFQITSMGVDYNEVGRSKDCNLEQEGESLDRAWAEQSGVGKRARARLGLAGRCGDLSFEEGSSGDDPLLLGYKLDSSERRLKKGGLGFLLLLLLGAFRFGTGGDLGSS